MTPNYIIHEETSKVGERWEEYHRLRVAGVKIPPRAYACALDMIDERWDKPYLFPAGVESYYTQNRQIRRIPCRNEAAYMATDLFDIYAWLPICEACMAEWKSTHPDGLSDNNNKATIIKGGFKVEFIPIHEYYPHRFVVNELLAVTMTSGGKVDAHINGWYRDLYPMKLATTIPSDKDDGTGMKFLKLNNSPPYDYGATGMHFDREMVFWGYCSLVQAWAEHGYAPGFLHPKVALRFLHRLKKHGDEVARAASFEGHLVELLTMAKPPGDERPHIELAIDELVSGWDSMPAAVEKLKEAICKYYRTSPRIDKNRILRILKKKLDGAKLAEVRRAIETAIQAAGAAEKQEMQEVYERRFY